MKSLYKALTLAPLLAGLISISPMVEASPIIYTIDGMFGSVISGTDIFGLSGQNFTLTATLDTTASPTSTTATSDTFSTAATLTSTIASLGSFTVTDNNANVTLSTAPGAIDLSMNLNALGFTVPVTAFIAVPLPGTIPSPLVASQVSGTANYGSGAIMTTLNVTGALSTTPAGSGDGGGGSEVPEPGSVALVLSGVCGLVIAKKKL